MNDEQNVHNLELVSIPLDGLPEETPVSETAKKPKRGRPSKQALEEKKKRGKVGRPAGDAARIAEFKARLLATSGDKVITKIIDVALSDGHPAQGAMLKFCGERLLPMSSFEKDASGGKSAITINITGIGNPSVEAAQVIDAEDVEYDEEDD